MKNKSLWLDYLDENVEEKLDKNLDIDVLIVGGGMTGLSTAYHLINKNLKVALIEKNRIGTGITSKSTAKITYLQETAYSKIANYHNEKSAKLYLESQIDAINIIKNIIQSNNINCDLEKNDSYLFAFNNKEKKKIVKEQKLLDKFNIDYSIVNKMKDNKECNYAIKVRDTYVFNPIKYVNELKRICKNNNITIYENTKLKKFYKSGNAYLCNINNKVVKTKYIILALHYPYFLYPFVFPLKVTLEKSYIGVEKYKKDFKYNAINTNKPTKSIRYYNDKNDIYKIMAVRSHNIAVKNNEEENFSKLKPSLKRFDYCWSNIDIITNDHLPFIGKINNNLLIGTGYNTWGMTNSTIAGKIISDIILNKDNKYIKLFNPKRGINKGKISNFFNSIFSNLYSFSQSKIILNKKYYTNNIKFEIRDNKKVAIYTDKNNKEHIVYPICPHLKCNLIFNDVELTWDCPCHGSRFNKDGKCIQGPSNYNISYKK